MTNVFDGSKIFACKHEFVLLPDHMICALCQHVREGFPLPTEKKALLFFPKTQAG